MEVEAGKAFALGPGEGRSIDLGAFAMTVHKAQGSEFDTAWLLLPRQDNRVLSRELVYTALTRARRELHLCAGEAVLHAALARHAQRVSGLAARLTRP